MLERQKAFIKLIAPHANRLYKESGIFASVTIAQACLETGFGKSTPKDINSGKESFNLFGVKGTGTNGYVESPTWEEVNGKKIKIVAKFRAYNNYFESLRDHMNVLLHPRYERVLKAKCGSEAMNMLNPCGYATDSKYGFKLNRIANLFSLFQYDKVLEVKEVITLDANTQKSAKEAIDYLAKKGMITNADYWKERIEQSMPVWAYMIVEARKAGMKV